MDHERFKNIASGVQAYMLAAAVLVGGVWSLYVFNTKLEVENSRAQLEKLTRELRDQTNLEIQVRLASSVAFQSAYREHIAEITFKNLGNKTAVLKFEDRPIGIYSVAFDATGEPVWTKQSSVNFRVETTQVLGHIDVAPQTTKQIPFTFTTKQLGLHAIRFASFRPASALPTAPPTPTQGKPSAAVVSESAKPLESQLGKVYWGQIYYFYVK